MEACNFFLTPKVRRLPSGCALAAALLLCLLFSCPAKSKDSGLTALFGPSTAGGRSLLARNHDGETGYRDELRLVVPEQGHTYLGLFCFHRDSAVAFVAGINEQGLATVAGKARYDAVHRRSPQIDHLPEKLLRTFDSVEQIMRNQEAFSGTRNGLYHIADRERAITVERTREGRLSVRAAAANVSPGPTLFNNLAAIQNDGKSLFEGWLWKAEVDDSGIRTLSRWIVSLPANGPPELLLRVLNPDDPWTPFTINLLLDQEFWTAGIK